MYFRWFDYIRLTRIIRLVNLKNTRPYREFYRSGRMIQHDALFLLIRRSELVHAGRIGIILRQVVVDLAPACLRLPEHVRGVPDVNLTVQGGGGCGQHLAAVDLRDQGGTAYAAEQPGGVGTGLVAGDQFLAFRPGEFIGRHRLDVSAERGAVVFLAEGAVAMVDVIGCGAHFVADFSAQATAFGVHGSLRSG